MLELTIYFQELNYQDIEQKPAYDSESLLGMCTEEFKPFMETMKWNALGQSERVIGTC